MEQIVRSSSIQSVYVCMHDRESEKVPEAEYKEKDEVMFHA